MVVLLVTEEALVDARSLKGSFVKARRNLSVFNLLIIFSINCLIQDISKSIESPILQMSCFV